MALDNAAISTSIVGDLSTPLDLTSVTSKVNLSRGAAFTSGTGTGQADLVWSDTRTLAASGTEDLDLAGVLINPVLGTAMTFARVKAIMIAASTANTNNVVVGGVANGWVGLLSPAATGLITLRPGAGFSAWSPDATAMAVVAGTGDLLHVINSAGGTSVTYDVVIIGSSA